MELTTGRIQSPSSINTYKQCPRKYYYLYIEKRPTQPSIHLVRGTIVHETLEHFFTRTMAVASGDVKTDLQRHLFTIFVERWAENKKDLDTLELTAAELVNYREESTLMLIQWLAYFWRQLERDMDAGKTFEEAFVRHTPKTEMEYKSEARRVRGFIDAIVEKDGEVHIRDYKTSREPIITPEYQLQLAIYALLYQEAHGKVPDSIGIYFLRHGEMLMELNERVLADADLEIRWVHERTASKEKADYPRKPSPLCNYCDFYDPCWGQKELKDFQ